MRSTQVYRALNQIGNRFSLSQTVSRGARLLHKNGDPFERSVSVALDKIGDKDSRHEDGAMSASEACLP